MSPQALTGLRIVTIEEPADTVFGACGTDNHDSVRNERSTSSGGAKFRISKACAPDLVCRLLLEDNDTRVESDTKNLTLIERGTSVNDPATHHPSGFGWIFDHCLPKLFADECVNGHRFVVVGDVDHTLFDERLRFLAIIVGHAVRPRRHQSSDRVAVYLPERTETLLGIIHAISDNLVSAPSCIP